ncbi:hypothetical protein HMPREF3204_00828 [Gardnerella pickettii]|nr:hypothetical protein HMPREF3204_00828 [Gardnerella pickettii]
MKNRSLGHNIYKIRKIVKFIKFMTMQFCDFAINVSIVLRISKFSKAE